MEVTQDMELTEGMKVIQNMLEVTQGMEVTQDIEGNTGHAGGNTGMLKVTYKTQQMMQSKHTKHILQSG